MAQGDTTKLAYKMSHILARECLREFAIRMTERSFFWLEEFTLSQIVFIHQQIFHSYYNKFLSARRVRAVEGGLKLNVMIMMECVYATRRHSEGGFLFFLQGIITATRCCSEEEGWENIFLVLRDETSCYCTIFDTRGANASLSIPQTMSL